MASSFENIHSMNYMVPGMTQTKLDEILRIHCQGVYVVGNVATYHTHGATLVTNQGDNEGLIRLMTEGENVVSIIKHLEEITRRKLIEKD